MQWSGENSIKTGKECLKRLLNLDSSLRSNIESRTVVEILFNREFRAAIHSYDDLLQTLSKTNTK